MKTQCILNGSVAQGSLILVNHMSPNKAEVDADTLVSVNKREPLVSLTHEAATMLNALMEQINGWSKIRINSGFRSKERQQEIWEEMLETKGEAYTKQYVAVPGHSEHETGLAVDLGLRRNMFQLKSAPFLYDGICKKFRKEMAKFGFIERYPKGKEEVTGIGHEPWHFRYVGVPHAMIMEEKGFTLEEYIAFLREYERGSKGFEYRGNGIHVCISFVKQSEEESQIIEVDEEIPFCVSGNNVDGFIITEYVSEMGANKQLQIA